MFWLHCSLIALSDPRKYLVLNFKLRIRLQFCDKTLSVETSNLHHKGTSINDVRFLGWGVGGQKWPPKNRTIGEEGRSKIAKKIGHHLWMVPNRASALSYLLHSGNFIFILSYYAQPLRLKGFSVLFLEKKICFYYMYTRCITWYYA